MLSSFHLIPERHGQTELLNIARQTADARVSVLTRDKNCVKRDFYCHFVSGVLSLVAYSHLGHWVQPIL